MRGLFLKIFLWFWATVILIGIALVLSFVLGLNGTYLPWQSAHAIGQHVVNAMDRGGKGLASSLLSTVEREQHLQTCLFDANGAAISGNNCPGFQSMAMRAAGVGGLKPEAHSGKERYIVRMKSRSGKTYIFATESEWGQEVHKGFGEIAMRWAIMLIVSSSICYLLTRRLTQPILQLRHASRQIADGDLQTRASAAMEKRGDEFGDLARDFNVMAGRIENLLSSQKQLISDVSHELRSPLARLNLALDLARRRLGSDPAFDRMAVDLERLDEMIGGLLTVAKLESHATPVGMTSLSLTALVAEVVEDAGLEARERGCKVIYEAAAEYTVMGRESLLRSAVENVVRNAIYYTAEGTEIAVTLAQGAGDSGRVLLRVGDRGPGVPEQELSNIFKPFYRVADARDRESGGVGLGLAIAERIVQVHGGSIVAVNRDGGGLEVRIELPLAHAEPA